MSVKALSPELLISAAENTRFESVKLAPQFAESGRVSNLNRVPLRTPALALSGSEMEYGPRPWSRYLVVRFNKLYAARRTRNTYEMPES